jgi:hypothetical protein
MSPKFSFVEAESTVVMNNKQMWQKLLNVILSERIILADKMTTQTCHHFVLPRPPERTYKAAEPHSVSSILVIKLETSEQFCMPFP